MDVFTPGDHGSTFGGNPLACHVALQALNILEEENLVKKSAELGEYFIQQLKKINSPLISDLRGRGLFIGMEIDPQYASARSVCEELMKQGILSKETHETVVRFAPPLIISRQQIDEAMVAIALVLSSLENAK